MTVRNPPIASRPRLASIAQHPGYAGVFQPGRLTFGLIAPLEAYPDAPWPTLQRHAEAARLVDSLDSVADDSTLTTLRAADLLASRVFASADQEVPCPPP